MNDHGWVKLFRKALYDPKIRELPISRRWVFVAYLLAAADSGKHRGYLINTKGTPMSARERADIAATGHSVVLRAESQLIELGLLERNAFGWIKVRNYHKYQPRKSDEIDNSKVVLKMPPVVLKMPSGVERATGGVESGVESGVERAIQARKPVPQKNRRIEEKGRERARENAVDFENSQLTILSSVPGYPFDQAKDTALLDALREDYPLVNIPVVLRDYALWVETHPIGKNGSKNENPRLRVRNFCRIANERAQERADRIAATLPERRPKGWDG